MENISEIYYEKLRESSEQPHVILVGLYCILMNRNGFELSDDSISRLYPVFGRLVFLYGKYNVFMSVLSAFEMGASLESPESPVSILTYFCRERLERLIKSPKNCYVDLSSDMRKFSTRLSKAQEAIKNTPED